jgi:hypothetical protein
MRRRGRDRAALAGRVTPLEFTLVTAIWDPARQVLAVLYEAELDATRKRACEIMSFAAGGRIVRGEALYGAVL